MSLFWNFKKKQSNMSLFIWAVLIRGLSGFDNASFYSDKRVLATFFSLLHVATILTWSFFHPVAWVKMAVLIVVGSVVWSWFTFVKHKGDWIHLTESMVTASFTLIAVLAGGNLIELGLALSPGLVIFNMPINWVDTRELVQKVDRTDDPTGKTYSIPILGIKVPRIANGYTKLYMALGSLVLYWVNAYFLHLHIELSMFLSYFGFKF